MRHERAADKRAKRTAAAVGRAERRRELEETAAAMRSDLARMTAAEGRQRVARRREQVSRDLHKAASAGALVRESTSRLSDFAASDDHQQAAHSSNPRPATNSHAPTHAPPRAPPRAHTHTHTSPAILAARAPLHLPLHLPLQRTPSTRHHPHHHPSTHFLHPPPPPPCCRRLAPTSGRTRRPIGGCRRRSRRSGTRGTKARGRHAAAHA